MRVTVTGGAGFVGSHLIDRLLAEGCSVQVIDDLSSGLRSQVPASVSFVEACITSDAAAQSVTRFAPSCLVHLAAQVDLRVSVDHPASDAHINVTGSVAMLEAARRGGALERAVLASSAAVYGVQQLGLAGEDHPLEPVSAYGAAKRSAEVYWDQIGRLHDLSTGTLRFANVYGPRQSPRGEAGVIGIFCRRQAMGQPLTIFGDGQATRDYLFVADVVDALWRMACDPSAQAVYNLGTGVETSVLALVNLVEQSSAKSAEVRHEPAQAGEVDRSALNSSLAQQTFGWRPKTALAEGIAMTYGEYQR